MKSTNAPVKARKTIGARTFSGLVLAGAAAGLIAAGPASAKIEGDTIILGSAISLTGKYSSNGVDTQNGYNLAVKKINEMGGVTVNGKSYKLKVQYYDDESTPARTAQLLERLIEQDGVQYILGPYSSATTIAAAPVTEKYQVPMIEAEGASRALFNKGYRYLFAVLSTSEQYLASAVSLAAEVAEKNGKKASDVRVAMVFENDAFSQDVRAGVVEDMKKFGMQTVIDDKMPADLSDISATLTKVKALKPDLLVISGHNKGAVTAARQIKELQVDVPMIAMTHCEGAKVVAQFGAASDGFLCPTQWAETLSYSDKYFGSAADYDKLFKSSYDGYKNVPYQSAQASAAVIVWKEAFERANSFDTDKVRDAISATDMETFYGPIKFSEAGNNIAKPMVLRQIQGGEYKVVAPSKYASDPLVWPREAMY
ncbi:amino acid ABC transporter substrate-binding protein [Pelagibius marinus]|uniref:amino acid ABC transporter substrate-binding protein n=1 Tax=Pelagibius marinus TaxID=2762760 RepID=UPI001872EAA6|nr:amino acid ABC transporter substrate-binding protein [Pelagibius marinus]